MSKTDWRKTVDKDWIGCYVLPDSGVKDECTNPKDKVNNTNPYGRIRVTLLRVDHKTVSVKGKDQKHKVAYFAENGTFNKPMLLSAKTNLERVEKLMGSRFIEDWSEINKEVILQAEWDKAYGGGYDWALRICLIPEKIELKEGTVDWTSAMKYVEGGGDPKNLLVKKKISPELLKKLEDARGKSE